MCCRVVTPAPCPATRADLASRLPSPCLRLRPGQPPGAARCPPRARSVDDARDPRLSVGAVALAAAACATSSPGGAGAEGAPAAAAVAGPEVADNPLLPKWTGPHGGVPPFDKVKVEHFKPAFDAAMDELRREIAAIAGQPAPRHLREHHRRARGRRPDLQPGRDGLRRLGLDHEEPRVPGDREGPGPQAGRLLRRDHPEREALPAHRRRLRAPDKAKLTPEQQRLVWRHYTNFVRAGAKLDAAAKKRLSEINQRLATLYTTFGQNLLADEEGHALMLDKEADLAGLPDSVRAGAAAAAEARGQKGKWAITNTRSSVEPFLTYSTRADLREKVWQSFVEPRRQRRRPRQQRDHHRDPRAARRAGQAARLPDPRPLAARERDGQDPRARDGADGGGLAGGGGARARGGGRHAGHRQQGQAPAARSQPWDYRYYAEKVRKAKYDLDQNEVKPYLQLEKLREGMFWVAGELFGFTFTPGRPTCRSTTPTCASGRSRTGPAASTWASGTSIPTPARASARAPG